MPASRLPIIDQRPSQIAMPTAGDIGYLAGSTIDAEKFSKQKKHKGYSEPFGVVLSSDYVGNPSNNQNIHIPRELQLKANDHLQKMEVEKNERVRQYIRQQDKLLEEMREQTAKESNIVADMISRVHPQSSSATGGSRHGVEGSRGSGAGTSSGLAAMLRGRSGSNVAIGMNPFDRKPQPSKNEDGDDDDTGPLGINDENVGRLNSAHRVATNSSHTSGVSHQSGSHYSSASDADNDEASFGHFDADDDHQSPIPKPHQRKRGISDGGHLKQMLAGSMPIQIPQFGSRGGGFVGGKSLSNKEYQQRMDELKASQRREQVLKGMPKTFVPPHELMDRLHQEDSEEMLIGSKPRDPQAIARRHAPG